MFFLKNITIIFILFAQSTYANNLHYIQNNKKINLTPITVKTRTILNNKMDYYINENNITLGVSNQLMLKLKNDNNLKSYLIEFNLIINREIIKDLYVLETSHKSLTINISNELSQKNDVIFSHPDFLKQINYK